MTKIYKFKDTGKPCRMLCCDYFVGIDIITNAILYQLQNTDFNNRQEVFDGITINKATVIEYIKVKLCAFGCTAVGHDFDDTKITDDPDLNSWRRKIKIQLKRIFPELNKE